MECPKITKCSVWKKLTPKLRFTLKIGVGFDKFIMKDCPLQDYAEQELPTQKITFIQDKESGDYTAYFTKIPGVIAQGSTKKEARKDLYEALFEMVEYFLLKEVE